jgi:hypothetical protein
LFGCDEFIERFLLLRTPFGPITLSNTVPDACQRPDKEISAGP